MASQACEHCGAIVAGDEQFCPSCGSFMDPMTNPRPRSRPTSTSDKVISINSDGNSRSEPPKGSESGYEEFSLQEQPPSTEQTTPPPPPPPGGKGGNGGNGRGGDVNCPSCGAANPGNNRHCQECGARLRQGPLPTAPRPAVQATAGVRAALAISGLLLGVIVIALLFNVFTGNDPVAASSTTTTPTTPASIPEPGPIDILDETCIPEGIGSLICSNLTSGTLDEFQVNWLETADDGVQITFTFSIPMAITAIHWTNIDDTTRFQQNYRASSITILAQDSVAGATPARLEDRQGTQVVDYSALNTSTLVITIVDAYQAEIVDDNTFDELAVDEIEIWGRPVISPTGTTIPADTGSTSTTAGG